MPTLAPASSVDFTITGDSTIFISNDPGWARVEYPVGTPIWEGRNQTVDLRVAGTYRLTTVQGSAFYEVSTDHIFPSLVSGGGVSATSNTRLRSVFGRIFAAASGAGVQCRVLAFGDSLGGQKMRHLARAINNAMPGSVSSGPRQTTPSPGHFGAGSTPNISIANIVNGTNPTDRYDLWPTGSVLILAAGGSCGFTSGGSSNLLLTTMFTIRCWSAPGGGVLTVKDNGTTVATIDCNAAAAYITQNYTRAAGTAVMTYEVTGGPVAIVSPHLRCSGITGTENYSIVLGGLSLANAMLTVSGRAAFAAYVADANPHLVTFEMDDGSPADFKLWADIIAASAPMADVIVWGGQPKSVGDATVQALNSTLKTEAEAKGWWFFDTFNLFGSYSNLVALGWHGDGTHPAEQVHAYAAQLAAQGGLLDSTVMGAASIAPNDRGNISYMAQGSVFGRETGRELKLDSDTSFGLDWWVGVPRSLGVKNFAGSADSGWLFSTNTNVLKNRMPSGTRVGGDEGPGVFAGAGNPEGSVSAPVGSIYMRSGGGAGTSFYVKESGAGNTGWIAK